MPQWKPFRPTGDDLARLDDEIGVITGIQQKLLANHPDLAQPDRVAHQYQIAGSRVELQVATALPDNIAHIGLFEPGARHLGIGRLSTGLGCPHLETDPDFLGLLLAFRLADGRRVDFLAINDAAAPTDDHRQFMALLDATAAAAGAEAPFGGGIGELDLFDLLAGNLKVVRKLIAHLGVRHGGGIALHVLGQTLRTAKSSTAYQKYWTGVVELGGEAGKFAIVPASESNRRRKLRPGARHLSNEWRERQAAGPVAFELQWLPYLDERRTPINDLTEAWEERAQRVGEVTFPQSPFGDDEAWSQLATELGANPGNWVADQEGLVREPGTEFTAARKAAYRLSQQGRGALPEEAYAQVFESGHFEPGLLAELARRRAEKRRAGHVDQAP